MKKNLKKRGNTLYIKISIIFLILIALVVLGVMTYNILFSSNDSSRFIGIEKYKLTDKEIKSAKDKIKELENVSDIDIYIKSKIIRVIVNLEQDIEFDKVKEKSNEMIKSFSQENLSYYDVEIFVESKNKDSEIYPKVGYKHKTNSEFVW